MVLTLIFTFSGYGLFDGGTFVVARMAGKIVTNRSTGSFDFELVEGDPDQLRTVVASPNQISPWIDPATIKLRHRIGRGPFGDVWLATQHQATEDYEEYHEVVVKMMPPIKEDNIKVVLDKFIDLFSKCQGLKGVCSLHGISIISGKVRLSFEFVYNCDLLPPFLFLFFFLVRRKLCLIIWLSESIYAHPCR